VPTEDTRNKSCEDFCYSFSQILLLKKYEEESTQTTKTILEINKGENLNLEQSTIYNKGENLNLEQSTI
jgi:hypothetical protein